MAVTKFLEPGTDATQDFSFFSATSGTVSSDSTTSKTGPRSIKLSTGSPATAATASRSGVLSDTGRRISFWFKTDTWAGSPDLVRGIQAGGSSLMAVSRNTSGALQLSSTGATAAVGSTVIQTNTWYHICVSYYITNTTTFTFKLYVNGTLEATQNAGTLSRTGTDTLVLVGGVALGTNANVWFDNIYVDDGADSSSQTGTGLLYVTAKRPFSNGTSNDFTTQIGSGGSGYGSGHSPQVNERPLSNTNGWSEVIAGVSKTEEYTIEDIYTGDVDLACKSVVDCMGWAYAKAGTTATYQLVVDNVTSNISMTTTNTMYYSPSGKASYPTGGTDIGIITDTTATTASLYECGVLVAFRNYGLYTLMGLGN